jgi:predicted nucleic acid-binding protein
VIAADSSSLMRHFRGTWAPDTEIVDAALATRQLLLPPVVLSEVLSDPQLPAGIEKALLQVPLLDLLPGYWQRAGELRRKLLARRFKARLADTLIAVSCVDSEIALVTNDGDFSHIAKVSALKLLP